MFLINEKLPNFKIAFGKEILSTDSKGIIEVKDKHEIESLLASGFIEIKKPVKAEKVEEPKVEEPKVEEPKVETPAESENAVVAETKTAEPAKEKKPHWKSRSR